MIPHPAPPPQAPEEIVERLDKILEALDRIANLIMDQNHGWYDR